MIIFKTTIFSLNKQLINYELYDLHKNQIPTTIQIHILQKI